MRFIYEFNKDDLGVNTAGDSLYDWTGLGNYTIEDTQDNIIWLINDKKSYEEMREYYVKG